MLPKVRGFWGWAPLRGRASNLAMSRPRMRVKRERKAADLKSRTALGLAVAATASALPSEQSKLTGNDLSCIWPFSGFRP
jgi:hypothetical protein